jgi:hypothetical protein
MAAELQSSREPQSEQNMELSMVGLFRTGFGPSDPDIRTTSWEALP